MTALSIVVVSFNTREMTLACLRSLFAETVDHGFEVVVVDNCSDDGSAEAIAQEFGDRVRLVRSGENLGFAKGNNVAVATSSTPLLLLLNPDTVVLDGAVDRLVAFSDANPDAGIWGGRTLRADGTVNPTSCWNRMTAWSLLSHACGLAKLFPRIPLCNPEAVSAWWRSGDREVDVVSGCFFLIRRSLWDKLGGFDPAFFMYGEEADLCLRAREIGVRPMVTSDAVIIHHGGASERVAEDKLVRLLDAKARLLRRHWSTRSQRIGLTLLALWPLSRAAVCTAMAWFDPRVRERARVWRAVWSRRDEWISESESQDHWNAGRSE